MPKGKTNGVQQLLSRPLMIESILFAFLRFQICKADLRHALSLKVDS